MTTEKLEVWTSWSIKRDEIKIKKYENCQCIDAPIRTLLPHPTDDNLFIYTESDDPNLSTISSILYLYDIVKKQVLWQYKIINHYYYIFAFSMNGKYIINYYENLDLNILIFELISAETGEFLQEYKFIYNDYSDISFVSDELYLFIILDKLFIKIDLYTNAMIECKLKKLSTLHLSKTGKYLLIHDDTGLFIYLNNKEIADFMSTMIKIISASIASVEFSKDDNMMAIMTNNSHLILYDQNFNIINKDLNIDEKRLIKYTPLSRYRFESVEVQLNIFNINLGLIKNINKSIFHYIWYVSCNCKYIFAIDSIYYKNKFYCEQT